MPNSTSIPFTTVSVPAIFSGGGGMSFSSNSLKWSTGKTGIWMPAHRIWTSLWHFSRNRLDGYQGLEKQWPSKILGILNRTQTGKGISTRTLCQKNETVKLNRNQLWCETGLLTSHCHLKGHLFEMELTDSPNRERCLEKDESATHILCDCEVMAFTWATT
jgi:hypothetical protein